MIYIDDNTGRFLNIEETYETYKRLTDNDRGLSIMQYTMITPQMHIELLIRNTLEPDKLYHFNLNFLLGDQFLI